MKPIIAIVGRPNVGKSTLFNRLIGKRVAVVEDVPGLTRDRLYGEARWSDRPFIVVDTGGFQSLPEEGIIREVKKQAIAAVEEADIVLMLMDAKKGLMPSDIELGNTLRKYDKKIYYVVNKIDGANKEKTLYEFYDMGVDLFPVSALNGYGFEELMDRIAAEILEGAESEETGYPKMAIVGRPNVGKSTFVNAILGRDRMIVSPVPGTTRDSVDSICTYYRKKYQIVDTAGIRRKGKMAESYEKYSFIRTLQNIDSCDVALILLNAEEGVVEMDLKIAGLIYEAGKGAIIIFNKWDLIEKDSVSMKVLEKQIYQKLWFMQYAPILTVSAISKQRITKIFPIIDKISNEASRRISTRELNNFLKKCLSIRQPALYRGKRVRLSYIAQVGIKPPSFVVFTNKSEGIKKWYIRFLEKQLRESFLFKGVPVRFFIRQKK